MSLFSPARDVYPDLVASGRLAELVSGIDNLYWSIAGVLPAVELERLTAHRAMAEGAGEAVPFVVGGEEFAIEPFGFMRSYRFHLVHPHGRVGVTPSEKYPTVYIQPDAEFLHGVGPEACVGWFSRVVSSLVPGGIPKVSRVDLFLDVQGWEPTPAMRDRFVTPATHRRVYEDDRKMTALQFGKRGSGIFCRIYCKSIEVSRVRSGGMTCGASAGSLRRRCGGSSSRFAGRYSAKSASTLPTICSPRSVHCGEPLLSGSPSVALRSIATGLGGR